MIKRRDFVNKKYGNNDDSIPNSNEKENPNKKLTKDNKSEEIKDNNNFFNNINDYSYKDGTRTSSRVTKVKTIQTKNERQFRSKKMTVI